MNLKYLYFVLNLSLMSYLCESGKILAILPTVTKSHFNIFEAIVNVLATEHKITFYSFSPTNKIHENITEKKIFNPYVGNNKLNFMAKTRNLEQYNQFLNILEYFKDDHFDALLKGKEVNKLINSSEKFDLLLISHVLSEPFFKLSHTLKVPLVQVSLSIILPWVNAEINNYNNLASDLSFVSFEGSLTFTQRLKNFLKNTYTWLYYEWIYLPTIEKTTQTYFPKDTPTIKEISQKTEGVIANYNSLLGFARPSTPNILEVGGIHCKPSRPLPPDLEEFINRSKEHGIIYFSFGGTITDEWLNDKVQEAILNVFRKLPQKILWKMEKNLTNLPENVMISKWLPQQDILGHPKTKLFISQGGILSLQEAAYHGVQILIIPIFCDQHTNGYLAERRGYGKLLKFSEFTEDSFNKNLQEMLNNSKYSKNMKLISTAIKDQSNTIEEKLKHWINFIIHYKNASLLRPLDENLSQIQIMQLDIFLVIILFFTFIIIVSVYFFSKVLKYYKNIVQSKIIKMKKA